MKLFTTNKGYFYIVIILGVLLVSCAILIYRLCDKKPELFFPDGLKYDMGTIDEGTTVTYNIPFVNKGNSTLHVEKIKASCACTKVRAESKTVLPGESSNIVVSYKGRRVLKKDVMTLLVKTNDSSSPFTSIMLSCDVKFNIFWFPKSISFMLNDDMAQRRKEVTFLLSKAKSFELKEVLVSSNDINAWIESKPEGKTVCIIEVPSDYQKGNWAGFVKIRALRNGEPENIHIPVNIMVN